MAVKKSHTLIFDEALDEMGDKHFSLIGIMMVILRRMAGEPGRPNHSRVKLTRNKLAVSLGASRDTIYKQWKKLIDEGYIREEKGYVIVISREPKSKQVDEPEPKPSASPPKKTTGNNSCPHGGTFGKDCDGSPSCEKCMVWSPCSIENERLKGNQL